MGKDYKVLVVMASKPIEPEKSNWLEFAEEIRKRVGQNVTVDITSLTSLIFDVSSDLAIIIDSLTNKDVAHNDLVIIRNVGKRQDLGIALANYLEAKKVSFTDSYLLDRASGKLASAFVRFRGGLPTPRTIYAKPKILMDYLSKISFDYPIILKADIGKKGRDNYLVDSKEEAQNIFESNPNVNFIAQQYIENDGDYRALVLNDKIALVIKRSATNGSHLNNISQGATAELCSANEFSKEVQRIITRAAQLEGLSVAGVDVIFDKHTKSAYILEVNRAPQLNTGAFVDEKMGAYNKMILELLEAK